MMLSIRMRYKLLPTMRSRDDPLVVDERATTEMVTDIDGHLPGLRVSFTLVTSYDLVIHRGCSCGVIKMYYFFYLL